MTPPLSATQIDTALDCLRKFGFAYFTDLPRPEPGPGAELGSKVHAVAEAYLAHGTAPNRDTLEGSIFIEGLPYLPPPGSGGVEGRINFEISGIPFTGFVDLRTRGRLLPKWQYGECPVVLDHKTSSDPKKWGLTTETLPNNVQALIYGMYELEKTGREAVGFRWLYYKTKGRGLVYPVDVLLTVPDIKIGFDQYVWPTAELIHGLWQTKPDPSTLEAKPESCSKYGGCPYRGVCKLTPAEKAAGLMRLAQGGKNMNSMEKLRARIDEGQIPEQPGINPPVPGVTQAPAQMPPLPNPGGQAAQQPPLPVAQFTPQNAPPVTAPQTTIVPVAQSPAVEQALNAAPNDSCFEEKVALVCALIKATNGNITPAKAAAEASKYLEALLK